MFQEHFKQYFNKLIQFDKKTLHQLLFIFQYNILYVILAFFIGSIVNHLFPQYDENKTNNQIIKEVILQVIILSFFIFYAQKIINCIPYIGLHYMDEERILNFYQDNFYLPSFPIGIILFTIILIATQNHLIDKINLLNQRYQLKYKNITDKTNNFFTNTFNNNQNTNKEYTNNENLNIDNNNNQNNTTISNQNMNNNNTLEIKTVDYKNNKEYQDRLLPVATRDTNEPINNHNLNQQNQHTDISKLIINDKPYQPAMNPYQPNITNNINNNMNSNMNNNMNGNMNNNMNNNMNGNMNNNMSNNMNNNMSNNMNNNMNSNYDYTNPSQHLQLNQYENTFQPLETNGNFSLLNDNTNNNINSSKLNYSEILNDMYH